MISDNFQKIYYVVNLRNDFELVHKLVQLCDTDHTPCSLLHVVICLQTTLPKYLKFQTNLALESNVGCV